MHWRYSGALAAPPLPSTQSRTARPSGTRCDPRLVAEKSETVRRIAVAHAFRQRLPIGVRRATTNHDIEKMNSDTNFHWITPHPPLQAAELGARAERLDRRTGRLVLGASIPKRDLRMQTYIHRILLNFTCRRPNWARRRSGWTGGRGGWCGAHGGTATASPAPRTRRRSLLMRCATFAAAPTAPAPTRSP